MRSLIFGALSIQMIDEERKWQTRRVIPSGWLELENSFYPYGRPGTSFYVKETWQITHNGNFYDEKLPKGITKQDMAMMLDGMQILYRENGELKDWKWRSPLFMPQWATRFIMEITDIRNERLHDITPADCRAEGASVGLTDEGAMNWFKTHWDIVNEKRAPYVTNPAVTVISFKNVWKRA